MLEETSATTLYRRAKVTTEPFLADFEHDFGADSVNRDGLLKALADYLKRNNLDADWEQIREADTEELVNALAMMSPWGAREKQALLDAPDLKTRADLLIALSEMSIVKADKPDRPPLQ